MDTRKIIAFGKSTFSITLPKKWVLENKLKKGDTVSVTPIPMGRLEISPSSRQSGEQVKRISINIENRPLKEIQREFIAAYTKGYSIIDFIGNHEGKVSELRRRLHELIAVEIMEVAPQRITANVFFDVSTISLQSMINRIELITKTIIEETQNLFTASGKLELRYRELMEKKREVDRQSLFAIRIIVTALTDPVFASRIGSDPLRLSYTWHLIENMEKVSDYILTVGFYLTSTDFLQKLGKKGKDEFSSIFSLVGDTYALSLKSYNKSSVPLANSVFDYHTKNDSKLMVSSSKYNSKWVPVIIGYLRRTSSKSRDIARITINMNTV